jgi:hypothetical protein
LAKLVLLLLPSNDVLNRFREFEIFRIIEVIRGNIEGRPDVGVEVLLLKQDLFLVLLFIVFGTFWNIARLTSKCVCSFVILAWSIGNLKVELTKE